MRSQSLLAWLLLFSLSAGAQLPTFRVDFDDDTIGTLPATGQGNTTRPTLLAGDFATTLRVDTLSGDVGGSTAAGRVADVTVPVPGGYRLLDFEGLHSSGIVTAGTVRVGFDFLAHADVAQAGFAFLRSYDESGESFADVAFGFDGDSYTVGLLSYDSLTGDYLGWLEPPFPANTFAAGTWHRFELLIDLDSNTARLLVDGEDHGVEASISRATGTGYAGAYYNFGAAFAGRAALDNFTVTVPAPVDLPAAPPGLTDLLSVDDHGGTVYRWPCADFRRRGIDWESEFNAYLLYDSLYAGLSAYRLAVTEALDEADARLFGLKGFPYQPNRTYEVSALIRTDFPRATWELNWGFYGLMADGTRGDGDRYGGMPAITTGPDGWERWTWRFTPHWDDRFVEMGVFLGVHEYGPGFDDAVTFELADLALVELPPVPLEPFAPGAGVTFPGGAGALDMAVEAVSESADTLRVRVTGADWIFDRTAGTLDLHQRIDYPRPLAQLHDLPLAGLEVTSQTPDAVVLTNAQLTIGVQLDGVLVISPHAGALSVPVVSRIGGDFNRYAGGDLLCTDDFGGYTVNVHTPKGTGTLPRLMLDDPALPFATIAATDLVATGAAAPGWTATATVDPGERLFVSAFPSRPFDWEKSFAYHWSINEYNQPVSEYEDPAYVDAWVLWNFSQRGWAMSFGPRYELRPDVPFPAHVAAVEDQGDRWATYFSQWFYYSRDAAEWAAEVGRWRDEYGMSAVYSDGLAQDDWLSAYEAMRRLRGEVFPDGDILIHDSYPQSGVAAAGFRPFIYAYATGTYMGESAEVSAGPEWAWARFAMSQFRRGNALGVIKGDGWAGYSGVEKYLIGLVWGGRGRPDVAGYETQYLPALDALKALWQTYGDDPYFFDRYYHPEAQLLTGYEIGRAGMPIESVDTLAAGDYALTLTSWTPGAALHYTTDGSAPTVDSPLYTAPLAWTGAPLRVRAFRPDLTESRELVLGTALPTSTAAAPPVIAWDIQPNPATDEVRVRYELPGRMAVRVELLDALGRPVRRLRGTGTGGVGLGDLPAGVYFVRLYADDVPVGTRRLLVR